MKITKRQLTRIIREETRRLREDHIDTELDHLKKNIGDDLEHIKDLKDDIKDDHDEELRAEKEKKKHESRRRRRPLSYRQLRRIIREEHADWGMGAGEESHTHPGEEDYTGHEGDESETHPGELDYEGDDVETKAHTAMAAVLDLASAAGLDLEPEVPEPEATLPGVTMEQRRRRYSRKLKEAQLRRIIRRNTRHR